MNAFHVLCSETQSPGRSDEDTPQSLGQEADFEVLEGLRCAVVDNQHRSVIARKPQLELLKNLIVNVAKQHRGDGAAGKRNQVPP